jgi:hypothetical protein
MRSTAIVTHMHSGATRLAARRCVCVCVCVCVCMCVCVCVFNLRLSVHPLIHLSSKQEKNVQALLALQVRIALE